MATPPIRTAPSTCCWPRRSAPTSSSTSTALAGKSFILYNDAPAPFPGGDPRNDYFTGDPDQTAAGGAPTTAAGHGPNTRTIMKIVVGTAAPGIASIAQPGWTDCNTALQNNFTSGNQPALLYNNGNGLYPGMRPSVHLRLPSGVGEPASADPERGLRRISAA